MKAVVNDNYGTPDEFYIQEIPKPKCGDDEVLIKIKATSVNPLDRHILKGVLPARPVTGLFKPKNKVLGADFSGVIVAVGKNVIRFNPGDEVFGANGSRTGLGAFAEYIAVHVNHIALKPSNVSFEEAAAVPIAALTALQGIRAGKVSQGHKVLVNGSSGGVGTYTVQLLKVLGAEVTAVCSQKNVNMVRSIGADRVINYNNEDYTNTGEFYHVIIDNVGNRIVEENRKVLNMKGRYILIGFTSLKLLFRFMFQSLWLNRGSKRHYQMLDMKINTKDLEYLAKLMEQGKVVSVIDRYYALGQMKEAMNYMIQGHARGKVVIKVSE
ncbi:NAD(P)-dependent alcohol dehydrogenase [bacterium SCSIO 12643]|nr:NAD(P)-dependent alcohol dehydrogenase [bacterium SCSIO 12643]